MPNLTIKDDDLTLEVKDGTSIIDLCEDHDTSILFGCRDGACGATRKTPVVQEVHSALDKTART